MLELEDNLVDGTFDIPAHINEGTSRVIVRSEVECAQESCGRRHTQDNKEA